MTTGIIVAGMAAGSAVAMAVTMPLIYPITGTFKGVFLIWSIVPAVAAILWWIVAREPLEYDFDSWSVGSAHAQILSLLRNKNLWLIAALLFLNEFFIMTWIGWSPSLVMLKGATPDTAGLISSITIWVSIPSAFFMTRVAYKIGVRRPFLWVPSIVLAFTAWGTIYMNLKISWLIMALVGIAEVTRFATILALPVEMMPKKEVGIASGLIMTIGYVGGFIGPLIAGRITDITMNFDISLLVLVGTSIASIGIALKIPETGLKYR
jgi:CP family cyanate transporter-like MFS transporter